MPSLCNKVVVIEKRISTTILAAFWLSLLAAPPSLADYVLDQDSALGKMTLYYSQKAIRVDVDRTKSSLVMKAPDWRVFVFNAQRRIIFETDAEHFDGKVGTARYVTLFTSPRVGMRFTFKAHGQFAGLDAADYLYTYDEKNKDHGDLAKADYWVSDLPISPKPANVVEKLYNLPLLGKLPLAFISLSANKYYYKELNTLYAKETHFPAKTFDVPTGFRPFSKFSEFWNASIGTDSGSAGLLELIGPSK